jgi:acyl-CoA thioesterase-1
VNIDRESIMNTAGSTLINLTSVKALALPFAIALALVVNPVATVDAQRKPAAKPRRPNPVFAKVDDVPGLPRVLLIGDSISIGYTLQVRKLLEGKANLHRPPTNCGPTTKGLQSIDQWLGKQRWDVIHFNWGLHDLKYLGPNGENLADPADPRNHQQVPIDQYEENLDRLVTRMKKSADRLIWRNTTPVPKGAKGRVVGDSKKYNDAAARVMKKHGVPTHDMYAWCLPRMQVIGLPADVHFNAAGKTAQAKAVARVIDSVLRDEPIGAADGE